jgi:hypothetical protein
VDNLDPTLLISILDDKAGCLCGDCGLPEDQHINGVFCPDALEWGAWFRPWFIEEE